MAKAFITIPLLIATMFAASVLFGREQEGRIDKVQRHGDEGQAKQR